MLRGVTDLLWLMRGVAALLQYHAFSSDPILKVDLQLVGVAGFPYQSIH